MSHHRLTHTAITPARLQKTAVVYLRQSTPGQVIESWGSTQIQRDQRAIAESFGWPESLITVIDEDLGRSGTGTKHRPGWLEMIRLIVTGTVGAVLVWMVSRLSRELRDFEELRTLCQIHGVIMIVDGRPADPRDPNDTVLMQIEAIFAQHDNRMRTQALSRARREKASHGKVVSRLPIGWIEVSDGVYDYDPAVKDTIDYIIQVFWQTRSGLGTVRRLNDEGKLVPAQQARGIKWVRASAPLVRHILTNIARVGTYAFGKSETRPDLGKLKNGYPRRRPLPEAQWIKIPNRHPPYMTVAEQQRIKEILKGNRFDVRGRPRNGSALCQGLLHCVRCRTKLSVNYVNKVVSVPPRACARHTADGTRFVLREISS